MRWSPLSLLAPLALPPLLGLPPLLSGCSPDAPVTRVTREPGAFDVATYCELAARPGLASLSPSSATVCDASIDDPEQARGSCVAFVADERGRATRAAWEGAAIALRAASGLFVVVTADERLVLHDGQREVRELAPWAAEPSLDAAGRQVVFVGAAVGVEHAELGDPTELVRVDLSTFERAVVLDDAEASSPVFVPDASAVLFVTTASGVASIARVSIAGGAPELLTNEGLVDLGQGYVPAFGDERVWVGERLVYTGLDRDERAALYVLDLASLDVSRLGDGARPFRGEGNEVLFVRASDGLCPASVDLGVSP